jgi:hypothetical protein
MIIWISRFLFFNYALNDLFLRQLLVILSQGFVLQKNLLPQAGIWLVVFHLSLVKLHRMLLLELPWLAQAGLLLRKSFLKPEIEVLRRTFLDLGVHDKGSGIFRGVVLGNLNPILVAAIFLGGLSRQSIDLCFRLDSALHLHLQLLPMCKKIICHRVDIETILNFQVFAIYNLVQLRWRFNNNGSRRDVLFLFSWIIRLFRRPF